VDRRDVTPRVIALELAALVLESELSEIKKPVRSRT